MESSGAPYDLDTSGGLMEQIQTLLAPPRPDEGGKASRKLEVQRNSRAANRSACDGCGEGGELLDCDRCPAAFHPQCCDPPLSEETLPPAGWICHLCILHRKKQEQVNGLLERTLAKPTPDPELDTVRLEGGAEPWPEPSPAMAHVRLLERPATPASGASTDTATPSEQNEDEDLLDVEDEPQGLGSALDGTGTCLQKPLALLIAAAMTRGCAGSALPSELGGPGAMSGSSKRRRKDLSSIGKSVKRSQHNLDPGGLLPLPGKLCFSCGRTCRLAPLIQCDCCPLLFHMSCTVPPLSAMPTGAWVCSSHTQHEAAVAGSLTFGQRCQLLDRFQDRISQQAVKVDFLQRARQEHWPHPQPRDVFKVPEAIKSLYRCPLTLRAPDGVRVGELICNGVSDPLLQHPPSSSSASTCRFTSEDEQREWLQDIIALQCSFVRHLSAKQTPSLSRHCGQTDAKPHVAPDESSLARPAPPCEERPPEAPPRCRAPSASTPGSCDLTQQPVGSLSTDVKVEEPRKALPPSTPTAGSRAVTLPRAPQGSSVVDVDLSLLDEQLIRVLAWQRIRQFSRPKAPPSAKPQSPPLPAVNTQGQARAAFYPLTGKGEAVNMWYRTLYIGTGADMDVCLTKYGHCNYVSGKHACIFYDENTKHYELLNYSEHGTTVDNVLYSCDFSEKTPPMAAGSVVPRARTHGRESPLTTHSSLWRCRKRKREEEEKEGTGQTVPAGGVMSSRSGSGARPPCGCRASSSSLIGGSGAGWEGTALLHHGSSVKLGCLQFVFTVTEFTHVPAKEEPPERGREVEERTEPEEGEVEPEDDEEEQDTRTEPAARQTLKLRPPPVLCHGAVP
ncbi:PHD finger protein 12-like isoform X1 [Paramormyrops kingsleyae]|uniref:PHD finger protein 12-like isoform X1 n=1 Tax=Paramormyrops kingsleyae TaxID=1676925 RepID=UPI000CD5CB0F|nr:PHD finger protein 12-like isoform X1 [Paramormyrops kingsleyae]